MKVELLGVSQGVSFAGGPQTRNFLDFRTERGKTFRIEIGEEEFSQVLAAVYGEEPEQPPQTPPLEEPKEESYATEFGGEADVEEELQHEESEAAQAFVDELQGQDMSPQNEEEVPSL